MRRALACGGVYIGSIIGAGFSSGQELLRFFAVYGPRGLWGILVATAMFGVFGAIILERAHTLRTPSHLQLLNALCGGYFGPLIDIVLNIFVFGALGVMLAATGTLLNNLYGFPFALGVIGMAILTREIVGRDPQRLLDLNGVLVFSLLFITMALLAPVLWRTPFVIPENIPNVSLGMIPSNWSMGALLYVSFNLALTLSPLGALGDQIGSKRNAIVASVVAAVALGSTGLLLTFVMLHHQPAVIGQELPILAVLKWHVPSLAPLYAIALFVAILTSCVGGAYGLANRLRPHIGRASRVEGLIPLMAIPVAFIGFDNLVQTLYPLLGYVGLAVALMGVLRRRIHTSIPPHR